MSYCRFAEDSDVYVFLSCMGVLECCACRIVDGFFYATTTDEMLAHLAEHKAAGHDVPEDAIQRLTGERDENDAWLASDEAQAERARWTASVTAVSEQIAAASPSHLPEEGDHA